MRHIKNYAKAKKAMREHFADRKKSDAAILDRAIEEFKAGSASEAYVEDARYALDVIPAEIEKWSKRLAEADSAPRLAEMEIRVEWSRNRIWGWNPHVRAWLRGTNDNGDCVLSAFGTGSASGYGYDKRSAAVDEALRFKVRKGDDKDARRGKEMARSSLLRFVIEHDGIWKEYAVDPAPLPSFCFGGKGMSTFTRLFRRIGCRFAGAPVKDYLIDMCESDTGTDTYHIIRKDYI